MRDLGKAVKVALAFTLAAGALLVGSRAIAADPPPVKKKPSASQLSKPAATPTASPAAQVAAKPRVVEIKVTENGYEPTPIKVKKDEPLKLVVTRTTDKTCANEIIIDEEKVNVPLPLNKPVEIAFTPTKAGTLKYGCSMGKMLSGVLVVE